MNESLEKFYENLLRINTPWKVDSITRDSDSKGVVAIVKIKEKDILFCLICGKEAKRYDTKSHFTLEFEAIVLLWLKDDSISTVATNFDLSWDQVSGIMDRAVKRGLRRREKTSPKNME